MTEAAVALAGVTKFFPVPFQRRSVTAVRDLNLQVAPGEIYGLLGPNGSGKSTTLKIILGLVTPDGGTVSIFGQASERVASRESVGFLPESPYFYKFLTGEETLRFYGKLCGLRGAVLKERVARMLDLVGLGSAGQRRIGGYSKGMLQRIGLAQALIHEPALLILDEPTAGVDPAGSRDIQNLVLELKRAGKTVLLSSHLLGQMQEICDRVGILCDGVLLREGALSELLEVETQTQLTLENAPRSLVDEIEALAARSGARLVQRGAPRTSLERLFLETTSGAKQSDPPNKRDA
ncbi:MAG TPA: ABC transporter ATP-binding protein [Chthoniobacterales bacterium]|jgi:ABC-2 type transport system ATP-binding protein|nr:ABC transporter ATP-binding protein [Chthoniobacterales bacterium]